MDNRQRSPWLSVVVSVLIPTTILLWFSSDKWLGPLWGLVVALLFPVSWGIYWLYKDRQPDIIAVVGLVGVLLTGVIGLFQIDPKWLAIKEAAVPLVIGLVVFISQKTKYPIVTKLIGQVIDQNKVESTLRTKKLKRLYDRRIDCGAYLVALSFVLSAVLNFILARLIVVSQPGTEAFNAELGKMTALSYPVIVLPSLLLLVVAVLYVVSGIEKYTGLDVESIIKR